ncbi:MAG TPA: TonB-dependent receptor [Methyloceanibacter sp.]|nr:TonB-dependent receptor [Methyloceanibacter sp.]
MMAAGSFGSSALAQEATPLPTLEVTAKAKPKKKPPARSTTPARVPAPAPVSQQAVEPVAEITTPSRGVGATNNVTPASGNVLESGTGLGRLPGTIQELPQTVNVVPQKIIEEQNATTLGAALRNVPGVTVNLGEGGAGMNGDQFRIRGFQAKGDIYVDGLRDFGVYVRDTFAIQEVQVIKGPTAESFGMGTGGGAINMRLKTPHLGDANYVDGIAGMGPMYRTTLDVNKQLGPTTAMRLVGMWTEQEFVDRDLIYSDRWGLLASLGLGLGTDTTLILDYFHQTGKRRPDTGVPLANPSLQNQYPNFIGRPVTEFGADRSNFYGKKSDLDDHDIDMFTARFQKQVNPWLTFYNDSRLSWYDRYFAHSFANCDTIGDGTTDPFCSPDVFFDRNLDTSYRLSNNGFTQEAWGGQNITTLVANFATGRFKHEVVAGIDVFFQEDRRIALLQGPALAGTIAHPNNDGGADTLNNFSRKRGSTDDFALFASERLWLTDTFSVLGGVRWDDFHAKFNSTTTGTYTLPPLEADSDFTSPKASVIWEPTDFQTYYASWARSYSTIAGQFISNDNNGISDETLEPEENELWEVGAKVSVLNGRLGLTGALFRIDKDNALVQDPITGLLVPLADNQSFRVEGFEFGLAGQITDAWSMQLAYAYLDSEVTFNSAIGTDPNDPSTVLVNQYKGNEVPFAPPNTFSVWTSYELSKLIRVGPGKFLVGGGVVYSDEYFLHARNGSVIPAAATLDGLLSYEVSGWNFQLNGYNLTDELGYDSAQFNNSPGPSRGMRGRSVPIPGRTVLFTVGKKF